MDNSLKTGTEGLEQRAEGLKNDIGKPVIAKSLPDLAQWRSKITGSIAFVPTMGALHDGHIELVRRARAQADFVVVSIFVNPFQFAPHEDFDKYPRTFESDLKRLETVGVDCVFFPAESEIYPHGREGLTSVVPGEQLNSTLEGAFRPTFFRGVATVVTKLFNLVQPHLAFFGEKDYQQLLVIKALAADLNIPVTVIGVPTVRESDGLAMSSRNAYLDSDKRQTAAQLHQALALVVNQAEAGMSVSDAVQQASDKIAASGSFELQYLAVCHAETLVPLERFEKPYVVLVAAKLGDVRLIDNIAVR